MTQYSHKYSEPSISLISKISVVFRICVLPKEHKAKSLLWVQILLLQFQSPQILLFQQLWVKVKQALFGPGLFSFFQFRWTNFLVKKTTYSILKTKQHKLHLADPMAVKVQLQLQFWQRGCDDFAISGPDELSEAGNECCDMLPF